MDEGKGEKAGDGTKAGNDGNIDGAEWTAGKTGSCLQFSGNAIVEVPHSDNLNPGSGSWTVMAWVKTSHEPAAEEGDKIVVRKDTKETPRVFWGLGMYGFAADSIGKAFFQVWVQDAGSAYASSKTKINDDKWHHLVGVRDAKKKTITIYVDGKLEGASAENLGELGGSEPLSFGNDSSWRGEMSCFNGLIDEVQIFNRALSVDEIALAIASELKAESSKLNAEEDKAKGKSPASTAGRRSGDKSEEPKEAAKLTTDHSPLTTDLVGYWKMDEGKGEDVEDSSKNKNHGKNEEADWAVGVAGFCLQFGGNAMVSIPSAEELNPGEKSWTVTALVKTSQQPQAEEGDKVIVRKDSAASPRMFWGLGMGGFGADSLGRAFFQIWSEGKGGIYAFSKIRINNDAWHHLAGVRDAKKKTITIYIDGKPEGSVAEELGDITGGDPLSFGNDASWRAENSCFNGYIDEVEIYSRALSAEEVLKACQRVNVSRPESVGGQAPSQSEKQGGDLKSKEDKKKDKSDEAAKLTTDHSPLTTEGLVSKEIPEQKGLKPAIEETFSGTTIANLGLPSKSTKNGYLVVDKETLIPRLSFDNAIIEADVYIEGNGIIDFKYRIDENTGKFYMFRIDTRPEYQSGFLKTDPEVQWKMDGDQFGDRQDPETWYNVKVVIKGSKFKGYVNGQEVANYEDDEVKSGGFSFFNEVCKARLDNLKIYFFPDSKFTLPGVRKVRQKKEVKEVNMSSDFTASWIWPQANEPETTVYFRKTINIPDEVLDANLFVSVDNSYVLYVNGKEAGTHDDWYTPKVYSIAGLLVPGKNVIALEAANYDPPGFGGMLVEGAVYSKTKHILIRTDTDWKFSLKKAAGWQEPAFNDMDWLKPVSLGQHPCEPWGPQVDGKWILPYMGPKLKIIVENIEIPQSVEIGRDFSFNISFKISEKIKEDLPFVVKIRKENKEIMLSKAEPEIPSSKWNVGSLITQKVTVHPEFYCTYMLNPGKYEMVVELPGSLFANAKPGAANTIEMTQKTEAKMAGMPRNSFTQTDAKFQAKGIFTDMQGKDHPWGVTGDGTLSYDGEDLIPVKGSDGVYFCRANVKDEWKPVLADLKDGAAIEEIKKSGITQDIIRCELVDHIDCSKEDHDFSDDGGLGGQTKILDIAGRRFRVTSNRQKLSYYIYRATLKRPGYPYVLVAQTINDIERYTSIRIQPPWGNVGGGVYTGGEYPLDGKPFNFMFMFYPRDKEITFTVSRLPCELEILPASGGAVSQVWVLEILDMLYEKSVDISVKKDLPERKIGIYYTHPPYMYELYGFKGNNPEYLRSFIDYLKFCGLNLLEYNAIDGGDNTGSTFHPSKYFSFGGMDLFKHLLPLTEKEHIYTVPIITSLTGASKCKELYRKEGTYDQKLDHPGWSKDSYQVRKDGRLTSFFNYPLPDPLRPEVQDLMFTLLKEIAGPVSKFKYVLGAGFRVNGKIGLCFAGSPEALSEEESGYSEWDLREFEKETGVKIPDKDPGAAYEWLKSNAWEKWIDWRCRRTKQFWLKCRDLVNSYRKDMKFWISTDLPSESPGRNLKWVDGKTSPLDVFRASGYDARMFKGEKGMVVQRGMFISGGEFFFGQDKANYGRNRFKWKAWDYLPEVAGFYDNPDGNACEFYQNYWEEFSYQGEASELGGAWVPFWGAATVQPLKRYFFQPLTYSIRRTNAYALALMSWERGSFGHEHDLRAFARAYRAIPAVDPINFDGDITPKPDETLYVKWFADRLAVVNDSDKEFAVSLRIPRALAAGEKLVDFANNRVLAEGSAGTAKEIKVTLQMRAYDLHTLSIVK